MNRKYCCGYLSLTKSSAWGYLLLLVLGADAVLGQTAADYSANPPFINTNKNLPTGGGSTVAAIEATGVGALYQAFYYPSYADAETGTSISWGGVLQAVFLDESGRFREDNGIKGRLEDTSIDYVVDIFSDDSVAPVRPRLKRFQQVGSGKDAVLQPVGAVAELDSLNTIWNARNILAGIPQDALAIQRALDQSSGTYAEDAGDKRYIFTWLDAPGLTSTGTVDVGEVVDFVPAVFNPDLNSNWRYLGLAESSDASNLISYIRGQDIVGWRSRLINLPGDDTLAEKYWILGDIINSSPLAVNVPQERYDLVYGDTTYKKFKEQYAHRRQMIYAGANDGMLHAFNAGVWDTESRSFQTRSYVAPNMPAQGQAHQLGAEMWAYVPMNLLPHLQWLKAAEYSHVYYVDGPAQTFDVNIFADDMTHPGGWGTILVAGMRFGGGDFALDLDADSTVDTIRTSAVIVMDITDPEKPPVLLAELTSPELNFTTGLPALLKARRPDAAGNYATPAINRWLLVLGSGPEDLATATSVEQKPTLVVWDLQTQKYVKLPADLQTPVTEPAGFYGGVTARDVNDDYVDDVLYVGTVEGTEAAPAGRLKRILLNESSSSFGLADGTAQLSTVLDVARPIVAKPTIVHSYRNNEDWVLFGTGRTFTLNDYRSTSAQRIFGLREAADFDTGAMEVDTLLDATDILLQADPLADSLHVWDAQVGQDLIVDGERLGSFDELLHFMDKKNGWYKRLQENLQDPAERVVDDAVLFRSTAIFNSYLPSPDASENKGESFIHALDYRTGTADAIGLLGMNEEGVLLDDSSAGSAELAEPVLNITQGSDPKPVQDSGSLAVTDSDGNITLIAGDADGGTRSIDLHMPPSEARRLSWELLDMTFQGD